MGPSSRTCVAAAGRGGLGAREGVQVFLPRKRVEAVGVEAGDELARAGRVGAVELHQQLVKRQWRVRAAQLVEQVPLGGLDVDFQEVEVRVAALRHEALQVLRGPWRCAGGAGGR